MRRSLVVALLATMIGAVVIGGGSTAMAKTKVKVARLEVTVEDTTRSRDIFFVVSYSTNKGRPVKQALPLVVFATGYGGDATNYAPLYDFWVRAGYVVAAPTFPDLNQLSLDIKFVRDEVSRMAANPSGRAGAAGPGQPFPKIDTERVALAGKSLGAIATFATAFHPQFHDDVFDAVIAMTGAASDADRLEDYPTPLLLIHGDADELVNIAGSQDAYARASGPKFFVTILGGSHGSAFGGGNEPSERVVERVTVDFLDRYLKDKERALRRLEQHGDVADVSTLEASP